MKYKILLITPYFAPAWGYGGPPRINYDLTRFLTTQGHQVTVLTTDALDQKRHKLRQEIIDGIRVIRFPNVSNWLAWNFKIFLPLSFAKYLRQNIQNYDFLYLSDLRDWQNVFAYKLCLKHRISYCLAAYGEIALTDGLKWPVKKIYDWLWTKEMIGKAAFLLGQTNHENEEYQQKFGASKEQCKLLPLGIDYVDFRQLPVKNNFRQKHKISQRAKIILFIGRINYLKGIDLLIYTLRDILPKVPEAHLVIIGRDDGYYLKNIQTLIGQLKLTDKITIIGPLYGKDNHAAYQEATVFAFTPRHYEETSLACLAALAMGTPVITAHQASIPFLEKYRAGFEIPLSQGLLTEKLTTLLKNPKLSKEMGNNGRKLIQEVFDLPKVGKLLEKYIKDAIKQK